MFEDTLKNNITLHKECSEEALERAIHRAGLDGFVDGHPVIFLDEAFFMKRKRDMIGFIESGIEMSKRF